MLAIRDRTFEIASASFGAILLLDEDVGWHLQWSFEIDTVARCFEDTSWRPRLFAEALWISLPAPDLLPGHTLFVQEPNNSDGVPNFLLYVFEHESVYDVRMTFGRWHGEFIDVTLDANADINWGDRFGKSVPIHIECQLRFEGINVWDRSEESASSRLAAFYDPRQFVASRARIGFDYRLRRADGV